AAESIALRKYRSPAVKSKRQAWDGPFGQGWNRTGKKTRMGSPFFWVQTERDIPLLHLDSAGGTNRLSKGCVLALCAALTELASSPRPLVITGNDTFFSAGAELSEIAALDGPAAYEFSKMGQDLMDAIDRFPAPVYAAVSGYCMGGGLDLALACHHRIASPHAVFGHR